MYFCEKIVLPFITHYKIENLKEKIINVIKFIVFLSIGLGILYFVYQNQNAAFQEDCALKGIAAEDCSLIGKIWNDFKTANFFWILMAMTAFTFSNVSRALRWNMMIRPMGYEPRFINSFGSVVVAYFANLGFPRIGEIVRLGMMSRYEKIPVEKLMGTLVIGRTIDVISILLLTAFCFLLEYDMLWEQTNLLLSSGNDEAGSNTLLYIVGALGGIGVITLVLLYMYRELVIASALYKRVSHILLGFWEGLLSVRNLEKPWLFVFHSLNIWLMYFMMTYLGFWAYEPTANLPAIAALLTFVFGGWGIVIPSPGGMGTYHFLVVLVLSLYGIGGNDAFSFANISFFSLNLGCNVFLGILVLLFLPMINRNYTPKSVKIKN